MPGRSVVFGILLAAAPVAGVTVADPWSRTGEATLEASTGSEQAWAGAPAPAPRYGTYAWPVRGPVLRPFEPPETTFGAGHRGIDIGAPLGTPVVAASAGVVAFAGPVAGGLFVSIDHVDGVRT